MYATFNMQLSDFLCWKFGTICNQITQAFSSLSKFSTQINLLDDSLNWKPKLLKTCLFELHEYDRFSSLFCHKKMHLLQLIYRIWCLLHCDVKVHHFFITHCNFEICVRMNVMISVVHANNGTNCIKMVS